MMEFSQQEHREAYFTWTKLSLQFWCFENGLTVSNFLFRFKEPFFVHLKQSLIIITKFISNVFANLRLPHQIFTRGKMNNALKRLTEQQTFAITNQTLPSEERR